jgi:hypothetical protein
MDDGSSIPSRKNYGIFLFATYSGPAIGPTQLPNQSVLGFFSGSKAKEHETDHLPPSSAKVKNAWR